ncbi:hypothetical protein SAMN04515675_4723 [Pseudomonas costantinii]|uniref:Uncharacterized protein n=1 Tax=Pseudomonas costantinii TaxID=168469 RepID=A0A1S2UBM3_9PSED|nr:hypothetical protein BFL40_30730 [Pseudomonas costantinii]SEE27596.1 hypothetical protein SAMN04515675_4723 [Pseudomonas costantinii]
MVVMVMVMAGLSIPRRLGLRGLNTFVRQIIAHQSLDKRNFEINNGIKKRHLTLRKLIEIGPTANWRSRNLCLSIRQF